MKLLAIMLIVFSNCYVYGMYQIRHIQKKPLPMIDEMQLLEDLRSCFIDPYVSPGNPTRYSTGTCIFDNHGQRLLLISRFGNYEHVFNKFEQMVNDDLWLYFIKIERRKIHVVPMPLYIKPR